MVEADIMICGANQWTGFYMISASIMKGLTKGHVIFCLKSQNLKNHQK